MRHFALLLSLAATASVTAQSTSWVNYVPQLVVQDITSDGTAVWLATQGGLVNIDVATQERTWYNRSNSGLPSNMVRAVSLGTDGDLWAATDAGVAHFDGTTWETYRPDNSPLPWPSVQGIAIGPDGEVWMFSAFSAVLAKLEGTQWSTIDCGAFAQCMTVADNGDLFVGTTMSGLLRYDGSAWTSYTTGNSGIPNNAVYKARFSAAGLLYLRCGVDLVTFDGSTFTSHPIPVSASYSSNVEHIHVAGDGTCYVTTSAYYFPQPNPTDLLYPRCLRLDGSSWGDLHHYGFPSLPEGPMGPITVDGGGVLWTGASRFYSRTGTTWAQEEFASNAPGQVSISSVHAAADGKVWAAGNYATTENRYRFNAGAWSVYMPMQAQLFTINDIIGDNDNNAVLATPNGVFWGDGFNWNVFNTGNAPLPTNYIERLYMDNNDALWVIPENGGILKYDGTWTSYTTANAPLSSNDVNSIAQHSDGTYWIGTGNGAAGGGGISRFDGTNWTTWTPANANLPFNIFVPDISIASNGTPWFLLDRIGDLDLVARFDGTDFVLQDALNSSLPQNLYCLIIGPDDVPFVGTSFDGLKYRMPGENDWSTFDITNSGIADNSVLDLSRAPNNDLWIATGGGVNRLTVDFFEGINDEVPGNKGLLLAPSIVDDQLYLSLDIATADKTSIEVTDAGGRIVHRADARVLPAGRSQMGIDTRELAPGSYVLTLRGTVLRSARFVVQH